jgi:glucose-6-phosphate 1-epimerase
VLLQYTAGTPMTDLAQLVCTALPSSVRVDERGDGLPGLVIEASAGAARVLFQGAHVTHWQPAAAREPVLWVSRHSAFTPGKPVRGGVPICFPWFGAHATDPSAPAHGFARVEDWKLLAAREDESGTVSLEMELAGENLAPQWPHRFRVIHHITVGAVLRMELEVRNEGLSAFTFEEALHTYFSVRDVRDVTLTGLEGSIYLDKVSGFTRRRQPFEPVRVTGETDRIYLDTMAACIIHDPQAQRQITIGKTDSEATVVWNPWIDRAQAMPDFGGDEWTGMICVETGNVNVHAQRLEPGRSHAMAAIIEVQGTGD